MINSVGAHWEGNQVWLILAGGHYLPPGPECMQRRFPAFICDDPGAVLTVLPPAGL